MTHLTPHEVLQQLEGTWDTTAHSYLGGPEGVNEAAKGTGYWEEATAKGYETRTFMRNGPWILCDVVNEFPHTPFIGHGFYGYDPKKNKYVGAWADSTSPYLITLEGSYNHESKTLTMICDGADPSTGKRVMDRQVIAWKDHDTHTCTVYRPGPYGQEVKVFEVIAKRRQSGSGQREEK
jgi:Protein of unknown function (DUF1579)